MTENSKSSARDYNFKEMTQVFLKKIRGNDTQESLSLQMNYNFNVYSRWETGARGFYWDDFLKLGEIKSIPIHKILNSVIHSDLQKAPSAQEVLTLIIAPSARPVIEKYFSAQKINRLLAGVSNLLFSDFLIILEVVFGRAQRFIGNMVETNELTASTPEFTIFDQYLNLMAENARIGLLAFALNLKGYKESPKHSDDFLVKTLQLPQEKVASAIQTMEQIGIIKKEGQHFVSTQTYIDTGSRGPEISRKVMTQFRSEVLSQSQSAETRENVLGAYLAYPSNPELDKQVFEICKKFYMDIKNLTAQFEQQPAESLKYIGIDIYSILGKNFK